MDKDYALFIIMSIKDTFDQKLNYKLKIIICANFYHLEYLIK